MTLPSASSLARALACRASNVLPQEPDAGSEAAARGTALHAYVEAEANGQPGALARVPAAWREMARGLDVPAILEALGHDLFGDTEMRAEESFAWDPTRPYEGRSLGLSLNRDYSGATSGEFVGTADVVVVDRAADLVVVGDYKFGHGEVTPAATNPQLRALALYAARAHRVSQARVVVIRGREDGSCWLDAAEVSEIELERIAETLAELAGRVVADALGHQTPPATPGAHCRYCRAAVHCPEGPMALAVAQGTGLIDLAATAAGRGRLLQLRDFAKRLPDLINEQLRAAVARGDTALPGGAALALESTTKRAVVDAEAVYQNTLINLGPEAAEVAAPLVRAATMDTIKSAAQVGALKGERATRKQQLVDVLLRAGALKASTSESVVAR
ncbi:MAG: DUF2800 domain-containing protein [Deltaproteobacteria bacterium]|nr:DUF2800 domain-containing protein [Myxococcales bacterium]MDP3220579.1 DUF2800 domain-containing protein [Deltaproteobacteria bacterium]